MNGQACVAAAADLTELAARLERAGRALGHQASASADGFRGLAGTAYRLHVARSALVATDAAADARLLAGGLAALGRGLDAVGALRERAVTADPAAADRIQTRAGLLEQRAQDAWRVALGRFDGAVNGTPQAAPAQPVVSHPPLEQRSEDDPDRTPAEQPGAVPATAAGAVRGGSAPPSAPAPAATRLGSALVTPVEEEPAAGSELTGGGLPAGLTAELLDPGDATPGCGTPEVVDGHG